ncbi:MAG: component of SufBCD complex, partial [Amaricoccus sp.]
MIQPYILSGVSFYSVWYWILTVVLWALICQRPLGVPYDMILRADRLPEVADRVDFLAHIQAERLNGLRETVGGPAAALIGFGLAMLAVLGFGFGVEVAQAGFALTFPMAMVAVATLALAARARREGAR